jgi:hypothetical protein
VDSTHFSEGGSKHHSGTPIYAYHYAFAAGTRNCEGISYRTGQGAREGDNVTVEFPAGKPGFSRIRGMRRTPFGPFVAFVLVFPLAGLTLVLPSVWRGWRNVRLLVTGETAQAVFLSKEYTNVRINKQTVYKLTFQFTDKLGQTRRAIARTTTPEWLQSHPSELVFYDAVRPEKSVVLRSLPGGQVISRRGELLPCSFGSTLGAVVGPCLGTSVIVGGLLIKLL